MNETCQWEELYISLVEGQTGYFYECSDEPDVTIYDRDGNRDDFCAKHAVESLQIMEKEKRHEQKQEVTRNGAS